MPSNELHLSLIELTDQLGRLLRTATPRLEPGELEHLRRARNAALVVLGEARESLHGRQERAITLRDPTPVWFPSTRLQEQLSARTRRRHRHADPFAPDPRGPRL